MIKASHLLFLSIIVSVILGLKFFLKSNDSAETSSGFLDERIQLGKKLFFETKLFRHSNRSCASCHAPELAFTDHYRTGKALKAEPLPKNTPSLINVSQYKFFNWASPHITSLEQQINGPLFSRHPPEMGTEMSDLTWMKTDSIYSLHLKQVLPECNGYGWNEVISLMATYCGSLNSTESPYDRNVMILDAVKGELLFNSKRLSCSNCHSGLYFSAATLDSATYFNSFFYTGISKKDNIPIRVPSLRNLVFTSPYFHDGSANSLTDVINHYAHADTFIHRPEQMADGFVLSALELRQLSAFLYALSDSSVFEKEIFLRPSVERVGAY